jgi:hypothetical protein
MKHLILILFVVASFSVSAKSQTTTEEYNYLTKGYKTQIENGLDMKKGYALAGNSTYSYGGRRCEFKNLIKTSSDVAVAVLVIFYAQNGDSYYFCIPSAGSDPQLFEEYLNSLKQIDNYDAMRVYNYFVSMYLSQSIH